MKEGSGDTSHNLLQGLAKLSQISPNREGREKTQTKSMMTCKKKACLFEDGEPVLHGEAQASHVESL